MYYLGRCIGGADWLLVLLVLIADFCEILVFGVQFTVLFLCWVLQPPVRSCLSCNCQSVAPGDALEEVCTAVRDASVVVTGIVVDES